MVAARNGWSCVMWPSFARNVNSFCSNASCHSSRVLRSGACEIMHMPAYTASVDTTASMVQPSNSCLPASPSLLARMIVSRSAILVVLLLADLANSLLVHLRKHAHEIFAAHGKRNAVGAVSRHERDARNRHRSNRRDAILLVQDVRKLERDTFRECTSLLRPQLAGLAGIIGHKYIL